MRTNEYYSKRRITLVISSAVTIYSILTAMSVVALENAANRDYLDFTPNFDKNYKSELVLDNLDKPKKEPQKEGYSLDSVKYDPKTLYLDWSEIEAEREKLEKERKEQEKVERKLKEVQIASSTKSVRVDSRLKIVGGSLSLPDIIDTSFKGYMCSNKITSTSSKQWKFIRSGGFELTTDSNGILMYKNYYVVAMGSYYTNYKVGSTFRVTLDSGVVFDVITGDEKADVDTDSNHTFRPKGPDRGEIIEFVVSCDQESTTTKNISTYDKRLGDLSSLGFQGNVIKIEKIDDYIVTNKLY